MTTTRRFGNIRTLPSGKFQARWQGPDGRFHSATFTTKRAAREWLSAEEADRRRGGWLDPAKAKLTLAAYSDQWMQGRVDLRPRVRDLYQSCLRLHVLPGLGHLELGQIDVATVRAWHAGLLRAGVGPSAVARSYRVLRTMLGTACEDGRISSNPCQVKGAGIERAAERPVATVDEVFKLADAIQPRWRCFVLLASFASLRYSELTALTRSSVDVAAGTVSVTGAAHELNSGTRIIGPPKSSAGFRTVTLPPQIAGELRMHLARYVGAEDTALVFTSPEGFPLRKANFHRRWSAARDSVGLQHLRLHDLRHTGNTLAATTGASLKELMVRMGHSSPRAALIYQHATQDRDEAIAAALGAMIGDRGSQDPDPSCHVPGTVAELEPRRKPAQGALT